MRKHWLLGALFAVCVVGTQVQAQVQHDYWPGRDKVIPHVSGDEQFSGTYKNWKDAAAVKKSRPPE